MKAMGKATLTLGLMIIVSLFLTSCSGGGLVTPELQLGEEINKVEEIDYVYLDVPYEKYGGLMKNMVGQTGVFRPPGL